MNLLSDLDNFLTKGSLNSQIHLPTVCFQIFSYDPSLTDGSSPSSLSADYVKNLVTKIEKIEDEGKNDEANQLEWLATLQILKYFETLQDQIDSALALSIVNAAFKRLKFINEKRHHINLGHFLVVSELAIRFFKDIQDYKTDEHRVRQKISEQASWLLRNIEATASFCEEVSNCKHFTFIDMKY